MPSQTFDTPGVYRIEIATLPLKHNFVIEEFWSAGGTGDDNPGVSTLSNGSQGGGGGACLTTVPIPNDDLSTYTHVIVDIRQTGDASYVGLGDIHSDGSNGVGLSPGEDGTTVSGGVGGDFAEGGKLGTDNFGWVTNPDSMYAPGGKSDYSQTIAPTGGAGGGAGGLGGVSQTGADAIGQIGGDGGNGGGDGGGGGNFGSDGDDGAFPGGGGGGGGAGESGTRNGGMGGGPKATISWEEYTPSSGGKAAAHLLLACHSLALL